jgi:hypothetical protein
MNTNEIIAAIGAEIQRLQKAKALLDGSPSSKPGTRLSPKPGKRKLSAEARVRIVAAQRRLDGRR